MSGIIKQYLRKISPDCRDEEGENYFYFIFRIIISALFFMHGIQKVFGLFGGIDELGGVAQSFTLPWWAGMVEIIVGTLVFLGIFARLAALFGAIEMLVAYFFVHLPLGFSPITNGGELALMFLVSFIIIFYYGAGKISLEKLFRREEWF